MGVQHAAPAVLLMLLSLGAAHGAECSGVLSRYRQLHSKEPSPYTDSGQMVYFLHVPRTAGRTFHSCMLKAGTPPSKRCPKAYDHLRLNVSVPNCQLLSSHDDFSVVSMLPENVAVLTHLRDPLDRFLSAYEFAVEVAARMLNRPANFKKRTDKIATEDVWPWSYLVPFFVADMKPRVAKAKEEPQPEGGRWVYVKHPDGEEYYYNKVLGISKWNITDAEKDLLLPPLDAYNNPLVMPLAEFVQHPVAMELLHNGQAFQVLGLTNYSHWTDANELRECFWATPTLQTELQDIAQKRLHRFMHVGVTDRLNQSVVAAAVAMKFSLSGDAYGGSDDDTIAAQAKQAAQQAGASDAAVSAHDLPDLADKVREVRYKLQSAQRELFRATQFHTSNQEMTRLKQQVSVFRHQLREVQDQLLAARAKLPTSTDPHTASKQEVATSQTADALDTSRILPGTLGVEYQRCAQRAQGRNLQRRDNSLLNLVMPDGRTVRFDKQARKRISTETLDKIRQLNKVDIALHEVGTKILETNLLDWKAAGKLEELPYVPPMRLTPRPNTVRRFHIPKPPNEDGLANWWGMRKRQARKPLLHTPSS